MYMDGVFELQNVNNLCIGTPVISYSDVPYFFYLHIPNYQKENVVIGLYDVTTACEKINYGKLMRQEKCRPWIILETRLLDLTIGMHIYKLNFVNTILDTTMNLYFAYIIHNANEDKPYLYMNREEES